MVRGSGLARNAAGLCVRGAGTISAASIRRRVSVWSAASIMSLCGAASVAALRWRGPGFMACHRLASASMSASGMSSMVRSAAIALGASDPGPSWWWGPWPGSGHSTRTIRRSVVAGCGPSPPSWPGIGSASGTRSSPRSGRIDPCRRLISKLSLPGSSSAASSGKRFGPRAGGGLLSVIAYIFTPASAPGHVANWGRPIASIPSR